jgi:zona occludens toxin (predicted ATPase)
MDNPFGPISSDHLLKPLFEIAKKYNTQLICLTDLKQNSIMNQFKVIFMMKIVPNTTGTMEYLKVEESTYTGEEDPAEENLEMLNYYQEEEQISLLDESLV